VRSGAVLTGGRDPCDEDAVGMVDEVVAGERVDEVAIAAQVRSGDGYELAVAGFDRHSPGSGHEGVAVGGEEGGRDQDHGIVARS
jgi:hypothetical protein